MSIETISLENINAKQCKIIQQEEEQEEEVS